MNKPPLGVMPFHLWDEQPDPGQIANRRNDVARAVSDSIAMRKEPLPQWLAELARTDHDFYLNVKIETPGAKAFEPGVMMEGMEEFYENAGYDIWSIERAVIPPGGTAKLRTGICTEFPYPYMGLVLDRSSTGFNGFIRRAGLIDCGYRNEWRVCLYNSSNQELIVESILDNPDAKACAQVVFFKYAKKKPRIVTQLAPSMRGLQWHGSSDKGKGNAGTTTS